MALVKFLLIFVLSSWLSCISATETSPKEFKKCYSEVFLYDHDLRHLMSSINSKAGREVIKFSTHDDCVALGSKMEAYLTRFASEHKNSLKRIEKNHKTINWNSERDLSQIQRKFEEIMKAFDESADLQIHSDYYDNFTPNSEKANYVDCTSSAQSLMNFVAEADDLLDVTDDCDERIFRVKSFVSIITNKIKLTRAENVFNDKVADDLERLSTQTNDDSFSELMNNLDEQLNSMRVKNEIAQKSNVRKAFKLITQIERNEIKFEKALPIFSSFKSYLNFYFPEIFEEVYGCDWENLRKLVRYTEKSENKVKAVVDGLQKCGKLQDPNVIIALNGDESFVNYTNQIYENFGDQIKAGNFLTIVNFVQANEDFVFDYYKLFKAAFDKSSKSIEGIIKFIDEFDLSKQPLKAEILYKLLLNDFSLGDSNKHIFFGIWVGKKVEALKRKLSEFPKVHPSDSTLKSFKYREKLSKALETFESLKLSLPENIKTLLFKKCFVIKSSKTSEKFESPTSKSTNFCAVSFDEGKYFRIENSQNRSQALYMGSFGDNNFVLEGSGNSSKYFWDFIPKWNGNFMVIVNSQQGMSSEKMDYCKEEVREWLFFKKCVQLKTYNRVLPGNERDSQQWNLE
jgi:hypothetical protein